jgi:hypothetical protein
VDLNDYETKVRFGELELTHVTCGETLNQPETTYLMGVGEMMLLSVKHELTCPERQG